MSEAEQGDRVDAVDAWVAGWLGGWVGWGGRGSVRQGHVNRRLLSDWESD